MPRRAASITQADVARVIRAAKQAGAGAVQVQRDGTITVLIQAPPLMPEQEKTAEHLPEIIL